MSRAKHIPVGTVFGRLTVLGPGETVPGLQASTSICSCRCGSPARSYLNIRLRGDGAKSCGCLYNKRLIEGMTVREVAERLDLGIKTVRSAEARYRGNSEKMKRWLAKHAPEV